MFRYLNEEAETLSRSQITALQDERLKAIVAHTAKNSPWSAARYKAAGIDPANFRGLADLHKLPFCSKKDFRDQYPLGMSCVPRNKLAEMHMSSGSTGTPVVSLTWEYVVVVSVVSTTPSTGRGTVPRPMKKARTATAAQTMITSARFISGCLLSN